ncbi:unnamed protein product [Rotaria magnacalcarata]|uniref:NAD(P)(+)--arginine ADP-ribosyltransferase n=1 Tax=Rotaria magnacalcarata TaxID=392030 RepID=A0A820MNC8_9BILA|nr:unnamed protein product [Rotaria magnacalcarata]CAF2088277.1 unnamed protein product [Rotaria magnacalcarata]CAF3814576.1 unnamed protein product [Rotaria magnacalcarata]CAF4374975.1 unnamed protein product [Rotaria magnacalcarata]
MAQTTYFGSASRFTDLYHEPVDHLLSPINGYQDVQLVSLTEAVEPVSRLFDGIKDQVFVALHNCQNPADGLNQDESAAIQLYTMQFGGGPSLYLLLNQSLRSENRGELKPWFSFLKLFLTALHKLPSYCGTVWRGIRDVDLSSKYQKGTQLAWWGVSSCTTDCEILRSDQFLGRQGLRTLFSIECMNGKAMEKHSHYKNTEKEIVLMPGSYFEVMGHLNPAPELHIIHLKEIKPPIVLIRPPYSKLDTLNTLLGTRKLYPLSQATQPKPINNDSNKMPSIRSDFPNRRENLRWQQTGETIAGGNGKGNGINQLWNPCGLFVADNQTIFIADFWNNRIIRWKLNDTNGRVVAGDKTEDNGLGPLYHPSDVLIDKNTDSLIISDRGNRRVLRWPHRSGATQGVVLVDNIHCCGIAMNGKGYLYISDISKHEVRRYKMGDKNGTIVAGGNGQGADLNQLNEPMYIFVDEQQNLYVSDNKNHRVMKWNKGKKEGIVVAGGQGQGNDLTQLTYPQGIFVNTLGTLFVADTGNERIMCWPEGEKQGIIIVGKHGRGTETNQLHWPWGLSFDQHNNLYVVDNQNHRVQRFSIR